jgi:glycosyltransferase involved in cell wall biosynthesis
MTKLKGAVTWYSNSPDMPTGYGIQTAQVLRQLATSGLNVAMLSNYGHEGTLSTWDTGSIEIPLYPRGFDLYSNDVTASNHKHFVSQFPDLPSLMIMLYDSWVLSSPLLNDVKIASWLPVDHLPVPVKVAEWCRKDNVTPLAMAKYGEQELEKLGIESIYIPHAVDTSVFNPEASCGANTPREYLGISEDKFVVGMNAANKAGGNLHRKAFSENIMAFSVFAKNKPDAVLYLHTDAFGAAGGWNLPALLASVGLKKDQVIFVDPQEYRLGIDQETLAGIYNGMDVYLGTSYGEGFGVGAIEAAACGIRTILSDHTASRELAHPDSYLVEGQPLWDDYQRAWWNVPNVPSIISALEAAYQDGKKTSAKAVEFAKDYDTKTVYEKYWIPALQKLLK